MGAPSGPRPLDAVDVRGVAEALHSGDGEMRWWYDPATGQVEPGLSELLADELGEEDGPEERGLVPIDSLSPRTAYGDMVTFAEAVGDRRASDLLQRALDGRGAFRRFRDTIHELEDLVGPWRTFAQARSERRAIDWLALEGHVEEREAEAAMAARDAAAAGALAAVGHAAGLRLEVGALEGRWADVELAVDGGQEVTVLRDGEPWATINPI